MKNPYTQCEDGIHLNAYHVLDKYKVLWSFHTNELGKRNCFVVYSAQDFAKNSKNQQD